jgi:hypothetical protein
MAKKKDLFAPMKINTMELVMNRSGKAGGHIAEVRRGCGEVVSSKYKKPKYKPDYSEE